MNREQPLPYFVLRGAQDAVTAVCFFDDKVLVSGTAHGSVEMWDLKRNQQIYRAEAAHSGSVLWLRNISSDVMLSQGRDGKAVLWTVTSEKFQLQGRTLSCGSLTYCRGSFHRRAGEPYVALPCDDSFKVVHIGTWKEETFGKNEKLGMFMALQLTDAIVVQTPRFLALSGMEDGTVVVWDIDKQCKLCSAKLHGDPVMCLSYDVKHARGFSGSVDDVLLVWMICDDTLEKCQSIKLTNPGLNDIAVRTADSRIIATAGWDGRIRIYSLKTLKPLAVLDFHREAVHCLDFGTQLDLASGSKDKLICLWNIYRNS